MPLITQQSRKARRRIEIRETQPVHSSVTTDQSSSLHVANQAIVLDTHEIPPPSYLEGRPDPDGRTILVSISNCPQNERGSSPVSADSLVAIPPLLSICRAKQRDCVGSPR